MALSNGGDVVRAAAAGGYAVAAINCQGGNYDLVRAVIETAEEERAPIIVMAYQANTSYYGLEWLPHVANYISQRVSVPVVAHLDHGQDLWTVSAAIDAGYSSVMIDYSTRPLEENVAVTREVIGKARPKGISVEAELGQLQRLDGDTPAAPANLVDPDDVGRFLGDAPVDMLAVGIGNAHGFYKGEPNIRLDLLEKVRAVSGDTPLVLHGSTGIPDATVRACVERGIGKINFGTLIRTRYFGYAAEAVNGAIEHNHHVWRVMEYAGSKIKDEVRAIIRLTGSAGRA